MQVLLEAKIRLQKSVRAKRKVVTSREQISKNEQKVLACAAGCEGIENSTDEPDSDDRFVFDGERDDLCENKDGLNSRIEDFEFDQFLSQRSLRSYPLREVTQKSAVPGIAPLQSIAKASGKQLSCVNSKAKTKSRKLLQNLPAHLKDSPYYNNIKHELEAVRAEYVKLSATNIEAVAPTAIDKVKDAQVSVR